MAMQDFAGRSLVTHSAMFHNHFKPY